MSHSAVARETGLKTTRAWPVQWRGRLVLLGIVSCFAAPLGMAWWLAGHWQSSAAGQHGDLLHPARPLIALAFITPDGQRLDIAALRGRWSLIYVNSAPGCAVSCRSAVFDLRQTRLALGKERERVRPLLLLTQAPDADLRQWLAQEQPALAVGVANAATWAELAAAFPPLTESDRIYLVDPLGNLVMRYPGAGATRGILKDLQRLLRLSKIG